MSDPTPNHLINIPGPVVCEAAQLPVGSQDSMLVERQTGDQKVAGSNPSRSGGRIFFSRVGFVHLILFGISSTPILPQRHIKEPDHSAESTGTPKHAYTLDQTKCEWDDYTVQAQCGNLSRNELTHNLSGNTQPQSLSLLSHCGLISCGLILAKRVKSVCAS